MPYAVSFISATDYSKYVAWFFIALILTSGAHLMKRVLAFALLKLYDILLRQTDGF